MLRPFDRAKLMIKFPSPDKTGDESWRHGPDVSIYPEHVIAIEPRQHRYHSFRPAQHYATIHLSTGTAIDVFCDEATVSAIVDAARTTDADLQSARRQLAEAQAAFAEENRRITAMYDEANTELINLRAQAELKTMDPANIDPELEKEVTRICRKQGISP
jgi:hypothetical protein